jgi:tetratricopeptide (TPR) repeat protein
VVQDRDRTFLKLAGNLWRFWGMRGPIAEGRYWLDQALEVCDAKTNTLEKELIVDVLAGVGEMARYQDDFEYAVMLKKKFLHMCQQWGEERWRAAILNDLAIMYADHGQCEQSLASAEEALALRRKLGHPFAIAHALSGLFFARMCLDDVQAAQEAIEEAIQIFRDGQLPEGVAGSLIELIFIAIRQERYKDAESIWNEFLPLSLELGDRDITASGFYVRGLLAAVRGQTRQAARLLGIAEQIATLYGFHLEIPGRAWVENTIQVAKASISETLWTEEYKTGLAFAKDNGFASEQTIAFALERQDE